MNIESPKSNSAFKIADPDVGTAKDLYIAMMATNEYSDFKSAIAAFNSKLKMVNRSVSFKTKSGWMEWIDINIGTTDFTDKVEFESMYDDLITKAEDLIIENEDLFDFVADADKDQLEIIFKPEYDAYNNTVGTATTSSACEDGCCRCCI